MKLIGFIDIHPNNPMFGKHPVISAADALKSDLSAIYIYKQTGNKYTYEKTLAYPDQEAPEVPDEIFVNIPAAMLDFRILNFPFPDVEKIRKAIPLELDSLITADPDEIVFDVVILADRVETIDVLVAYLRKDVLQQLLLELARWKINPQVVTAMDLRPVIQNLKENRGQDSMESVTGLLENSMEWDVPRRIREAQMELLSPVINLRSGQFAYKKDVEKTKRARHIMLFLTILLAIAIHIGFFSQTLLLKKQAASISKEMRNAYTALFPADRKVVDELYQLKSHLRETQDRVDALTGIEPLRLLINLSQRMESNVVYTDIHLEKGIITMKAEARSMDDLPKITAKLSGFLSGVSITDVRPGDRGKVFFTVVAKEQL